MIADAIKGIARLLLWRMPVVRTGHDSDRSIRGGDVIPACVNAGSYAWMNQYVGVAEIRSAARCAARVQDDSVGTKILSSRARPRLLR
jgi:hypothetical protein